MKNPIKDIKFIEKLGNNLVIIILFDGYAGAFRINYEDQSRRNARYRNLKVFDIYNEIGYQGELDKIHTSGSYHIEDMLYSVLWIQIHKQYLLEECIRKEFV
jgi:hypothetical protein